MCLFCVKLLLFIQLINLPVYIESVPSGHSVSISELPQMDPLAGGYVHIDQFHILTAPLIYNRYLLLSHSLPLGLSWFGEFHLKSIQGVVFHHATFQHIICIDDSWGLLSCNPDKVLCVFVPGTQFGGEPFELVVKDTILREGSEGFHANE